MKRFLILFLLAATTILHACSDARNEPEPLQPSTVYVTNEGNFSDANGSITTFDPQEKTSVQQAFQNANGRPLAGIIQSTTVIDGQMYIVLNNADKIEVVDAVSFTSVGTITLSKTPVALVKVGDDRAYVSNLYDNSVAVIDLENLEETAVTIPVGMNPQAMVRVNNRVYVSNNGFGNENTISVINVELNAVESTLTVGNGPGDLIVDEANRIWVVCNGLIAYDDNFNRDPENDIAGSVYVLDGENGTVLSSIATGGHPGGLALNEQARRGYLLNGGVQIINMNSMEIAAELFVDRTFNAIAYSVDEELIYMGQSRGFAQKGQAIRYDLNGVAIDSFSVGIAPAEFKFVEN